MIISINTIHREKQMKNNFEQSDNWETYSTLPKEREKLEQKLNQEIMRFVLKHVEAALKENIKTSFISAGNNPGQLTMVVTNRGNKNQSLDSIVNDICDSEDSYLLNEWALKFEKSAKKIRKKLKMG